MIAEWHKSSYSSGNNECVEVREHASGTDVRDTAHREAGHITVPLGQWVALVAQARGTH
ncbi:hypothetical protein HNR06_002001 [Nocardiopsis arvandica]|uniref:DUF397 domain-containing protein n=1 Tax=Nocardiopsis sinuspersici TaxID=501010 RepID=A0A7Z0BKF7_9ACTN|nr:DUF397 domain-containing protein [Nocardiopsis sinuspersici]NYH52412.1 hypothetical protein [Nocardiopsis sinuspersici]